MIRIRKEFVSWYDAPGRTIEKVVDSAFGVVFLTFTDGTYTGFRAAGSYDDHDMEETECDPMSFDFGESRRGLLIDAGFFTEEEYWEERRKQDAQYETAYEKKERKELARLKAKYE